ncbi:MAG: DUF72 domain-containing protein [Calditrichaeota bacterium]|nr:DUF72 domain-containing protein [Calditrichota bacterium]
MKRIWIGTSGWSYKHWIGRFYPSHLKPSEFLEYYVQHFDCTELNASFYRLPKPAMVEGWLTRTPPHFRLCPKLSRLITHQKKLVAVEEALASFFEVFSILKEKLGPILIQLPPSMRFDASRAQPFFQLLRERYQNYQFALEVRHDSWFDSAALNLLREYRIAFVIAHSGGRFPYLETVTGDLVYLRFHGPGRLYASDYPDEMLETYAQKMVDWAQQGLEVWAFFNNDVEGYAVKNAKTLQSLVQRYQQSATASTEQG